MEVIVILTLCAALGVLSVRYGHDSRDGARSKEQDLASWGVTWRASPGANAHTSRNWPARVRHRRRAA
jgi:hypothetical protein